MSYLRKNKKVVNLGRPVTVLYDDREKKPWKIQSPDFTLSKCRLKCGDYTINGYSHIVAIEKKSGLKEFITNLGKKDRIRFERSLERLAEYPIKAIIIEACLDHRLFSTLSSIPTRLGPSSVYYWLNKIIVHYGIPVLFIGRNAVIRRDMLVDLFTWVVREIEYGTYK